ncbi:MAG: outer membrane protein assembly factor BamA [Xanthomonadales bacterium]|nr:outer membrane protein assembly factor BamA [Xanthomonadales bacterium]
MKKLLFLGLLLASAAVSGQNLVPYTVSDIRVEGLQRIAPGTVFNYLPLEVGDRITQSRAAEAIRALFSTGFFQDVSLARQGDILVVRVVERPAIAEIEIEGNRDIKTEDLMRVLADFGLAEGEVFERVTLDRIQQSLTREYFNRGKYNVAIDTQVQELQRNRVKVNIDIAEGDAAQIKHINIVGNEAFTDEEILEDFESSTPGFLSWYTKDDQYSREKLQGDLEALRSYYQDRGYVDFDVESTQVTISPDKKDIYITANVREGEVYTVSEIQLTGDFVNIPEESLRNLVVIQEGQTFSRRLVEASVDNITATLTNIGYAFANVSPYPEIDKASREVKIVFFVEPNKRVYVRRINFYGNSKTRDEVLRREMRQFEGGWFSQALIDRSRLRLQRLSYLEEVNIETPRVPGTEDQVDVNVTVKERTAGSFTFGLGFSQTTGVLASLSISQENFLGTGKQLGLSLNSSSFFKRIDLSFVNPYFTDDGVSVGYQLSIRELDQGEANIASFLTDTVGLSTSFGIPLTEVDRVRLLVGVEDTEITPFPGAGDEIRDELTAIGDEITTYRSEISWSRDSRNRFFNPTSGSVQRASFELALPGSTVEYYKVFYSNTSYFPLNRYLTFVFGGEVGYGDVYGDAGDAEDTSFGLPFFEHFFAGGVRSVRGYEDNTLGPRTTTTIVDPDDPDAEPVVITGRPFGGDLKVTGSAEVVFPTPFVSGNTTRLSWFLDFGQVYEDLDAFDSGEIRYTTGISLQWQAPVGPVVINLAFPLNEEEGDETETIQFAFGNFF